MNIVTHPVIDFHGPSDGCGERLKLLTLQNKATCVKAIDSAGWAFEAASLAREFGVPHTIIFRQTQPKGLPDDHPDLNLTPEAAAEKLWRATLNAMPPELIPFKDLIYIEPTNEPGVVTAPDKQEQARWIGRFCVEIAEMMLADGWNPALAGFNAGTPSPQQIQDYFIDLLRLFEREWDRCLWTLHEAKLGGFKPGLDFETKGLQPFVPGLINSSQQVFAVCDELGIRRPRTFISEFAWSHNDIPGNDQFRAEVQEACHMDAQWPEVVGRVIYTTHAGGTMWGGLRKKLTGNSPWLTEYVTTTMLNVEAANPAPTLIPSTDTAVTQPASLPSTGDNAVASGFDASIDLVNQSHAPGTTYRATWSFNNSGQTIWNGQYQFVFSEEAHPQTAPRPNLPLAAMQAFAINTIGAPDQVHPGQSVNLSLDLTLPSTPGKFSSNWQLQAPDGRRFGPIRWTTAEVAGELTYELVSFQNSVADFDNLQPGRSFNGTWVLRNNGSVTWPGDVRLAYVDSHNAQTQGRILSKMGAAPSATLRELTGQDVIAPGQEVAITLDFIAPQEPGRYAFNWVLQTPDGEAFGTMRWMGIGVAGAATPDGDTQPQTPGQAEFGMNVNINGGHAPDAARLKGLSWARFVYWAGRENWTPAEAFANRYQGIIQAYAEQGIKSLLVLHQDTFWGNGPWNNGDWDAYAQMYAEACAQVARACAPFRDKVAYQIFNETDSGFGADAPFHNPSAIGIPPEKYALILDKAAAAIRAVDPQATIVLGGLKTGPDNAVNYLKAMQSALGKPLPVDAIAFHPYGRYVNHAPFNFAQIGKLSDAIRTLSLAFPGYALWITEIGTPGHQTVLGPEHYQSIATYMDEVVRDIANKHADKVPVLMWFAWSDVSENAGIVTLDGQIKDKIGDAFRTMIALNRPPQSKSLEALAQPYNAEFLSFTSTLANHNAVPAGSTFTNAWTFRNTGTKPWDDACRLVYAPAETAANNEPMSTREQFAFADLTEGLLPVRPGEELTIRLDLTAPEKSGRLYTSRWELRGPADETIGHLYSEITVVPAPTAGTPTRRPDLVFIADHTVADGSPFTEGQAFDKQWLVRNSGTRHWGDSFRLIFVDGDLQMARGNASHVVPPAAPGEQVILTIPMTSPPARGRATSYQSTWRLQDDHGNYFGQPLWAQITSLPADALSTVVRFNDPRGWYSQRDPRWAGARLGHGGETIGSWGCLLTCMAMMLTAYGRPFTPAELNDQLRHMGDGRGFSGSAVHFAAPPSVLPGLIMRSNLRSWPSPEIPETYWQDGIDPIQRIDTALKAGDVIIAQVDHTRNNAIIDQHWVILLQRTPAGDDYEILDPLAPHDRVERQPLSLMSLYGSPHPSRSHEENLRNAIKSALLYQLPTVSGG